MSLAKMPDQRPQSPEPHKKNLLNNKILKSIMKSRWYPGIIQVPVLFVFP